MKDLIIRRATKDDVPRIHELIVELAIYERQPDAVTNTIEDMYRDGFGDKPVFEAIVAEKNGLIIGFSLYYTRYSTWKGRCLYLEDFVITETERGKGYGKLLFEATILEAKRQKMNMMTWQVLDWNEPAINFYKKWNANLDPEWINGKFFKEDIDAYQAKFLIAENTFLA